MADNDQSINNLRYNQVTQGLEGFGGGTPQWTPLTLVADGGFTQLTGDVTAGPGSGSQAATLATVNLNVGSFTSANITVDAKGRITAASSGSGAVPGGNDRDIQFNDSGTFGGNDHLKFLNDEEVAIFGTGNSNLSLNHDTADHIYFNNGAQSITFASISGDTSGLTLNVSGFVNQFLANGNFSFANNAVIYDSGLDRTQFNDIILEGKLYAANPLDIIPSAGPEHWVISKGEMDQFNDAGGSLVFNNLAGSQTFVNLTADTDHSLRITGNNNLAKFAISDGYVVFGVNDLTQVDSSVLTVHGQIFATPSIKILGGGNGSNIASHLVIESNSQTGTDAAIELNYNAPDTAGVFFNTEDGNTQKAYFAHNNVDFVFVNITGGVIFTPDNNGSKNINITSNGLGVHTTAAASAVLDVVSTSQGFAPPRMTTGQKNAIGSPVEGLVVYDTTLHKLSVFTGTVWETVTSI